VRSLQDAITGIIADIEASFITEDESLEPAGVTGRILPLCTAVHGLLGDARARARIYEGIVTTIAGLPNAGKSSLFNAILGYDRAIVHHEEGTTRDVLRSTCASTVSISYSTHARYPTERLGPRAVGVEKTLHALRSSDLLLYVVDARQGMQPHEHRWLDLAGKTIVVMNKIDLVAGGAAPDTDHTTVPVSAKHGTGISDLMSDDPGLSPRRHPGVHGDGRSLLEKTGGSLDSCRKAIEEGLTLDAIAIDLRQAAGYLSRMTGESAEEDILEKVFSRFCIGK
jgi:tRNA modification GTPase